MGVFRWVEATVLEPSYFKLSTEHTPVHLALLDEVAAVNPLLHSNILDLLVRLFESRQDELEILVQLEMRKMLLDRMVNLLTRGYVVPIVKYIKQCWQRGDTDISLIRYFVTEVVLILTRCSSESFKCIYAYRYWNLLRHPTHPNLCNCFCQWSKTKKLRGQCVAMVIVTSSLIS